MAEDGIELYDVAWHTEGSMRILQVSIMHKDGSMDIDTCAAQSEKISAMLDELDMIASEYFLEVCSPGAERELKNEEQIKDAIGEFVYVKLKNPKAGMDDVKGTLTAFENNTVYLDYMAKAVKKKAAAHSLTTSDKIDRIVTNRILALPIFAVVMFAVYYVAIGTVGDWVTGWTNDVLFGEIVPPAVSGWLEGIGTAPWLQGLIVDGIIAGVGAVLGFVPQMLVLFLMLSILEDVGYMARVAFIMDRIFRKFGLSGKSFIPMLIGSGCGVPGVMASRTIENERDRRMTVMTTCFVPCGAKMPIIGLFAGALFGGSGLVAVSAYFIGVAAIIFSGIILKKTKAFAGDPAPLRYGAARLPRALCGQRPAGHLGARLVLHQAGRHHHPGLLHHPLVPPGLRLYRGGLRHGGGQQHLPAGGHWRRGVLHFPAPGLRHLAGHRGHRYRPHRQGERGVHLRRALRSGRRSDGGGPPACWPPWAPTSPP